MKKNVFMLFLFLFAVTIGYSQSKDNITFKCYNCETDVKVDCNGCDIEASQLDGIVFKGWNMKDLPLYKPLRIKTKGTLITIEDPFGTVLQKPLSAFDGYRSVPEFLSGLSSCICPADMNTIQDISTDGSPGNVSLSDGSTITVNVNDADADPLNEIQDISTDGTSGNITISDGSTLTLNVDDEDPDPTNEFNTNNELTPIVDANGDTIGITSTVTDGGGPLSSDFVFPECKPEVDGDITNELQTISENNGTVTLSNGGGEFELPVSTLTETSNGDGTTTYTHTAGGVTTTFCAIDKNLPPTFAVDFVEPEVESCTGSFDLSEGGDIKCIYGQTLYTLTSIPDGYFAVVDAVSGVVTFSKINDCGDCNCEAETLMFEYDLVSQCGTESATHVVPIAPEPTGDLIVNTEMNFVEVADGETPTQIEIAICATNDPNATGNLVAVTLTDDLDPAFFTNVTSNDPNITIAGNIVTLNATGLSLAPGDQLCGVYIADAVFPNTHFPNVVSGEATDESGGTSTDSAPEVLPAIPVPEARLTWADVNGANGTVTTASQSYVKTDGAPVADGEPFRFEVRLEDGTLWETITGTLNGGDYSSDRTDGLSITNFSPTGDFGNSLTFGFNKRDWANATNFNYRAVIDQITDTSNLEARTNAQELETAIYAGGQGSVTCPIESINPDNISSICKIVIAKQSGVFAGSGNANGGNWVDGVTVYNANNGVGSIPELDNAEGSTIVIDRVAHSSIGSVTQNQFTYNNPAYFQDFAEGLDNEWELVVTEVIRPNGLISYNEHWHRDGAGTVENAQISNTMFIRRTTACNTFDLEIRFNRTTQSGGVVSYSGITYIADVDGTVYNLPTNTAIWQSHTFSGIGIYDITNTLTATPTPDGNELVSFQNSQIELNYWY